MMRNVEIKARVKNLADFLQKADQLCNGEKTILKQHDTFYNVTNGRLKLRRLGDTSSQLVFYDRLDVAGPKLSEYEICPFPRSSESTASTTIDSILRKSLGVKGDLKKTRHLFMVDQTRIHVDEVENLGSFMELEVVLKPEQSVSEGEAIADDLCTKLGVQQEDLLEGAYIDMLKS